MKKLILAAGAFALSATTAFAGSFAPAPVEPQVYTPAPRVMAYNWTGGYAGAGLSYGRGSHNFQDAEDDDLTLPNSTGAGLGAFVGYNWQNGNMVFGGEVLGVFSRMSGTSDCGSGLGEEILSCESRINNFGAIRARLGFAIDNTLLFMTAGYALDNQRYAVSVAGIEVESVERRFTGPVIGVGVEHGFSPEWSVRGDLEHYRFGTQNIGGESIRATTNLARISIVRRF